MRKTFLVKIESAPTTRWKYDDARIAELLTHVLPAVVLRITEGPIPIVTCSPFDLETGSAALFQIIEDTLQARKMVGTVVPGSDATHP